MIIINASMRIDPIIKHIEEYVMRGANEGAKEVAFDIARKSREKLSEKISETGGHETGNLSQAIMVANADSGIPGFKRWDVIVDTNKAPYALWVEFGRRAGAALPYASTGTKDFSKSKFKGHKFLTETVKEYSDSGLAVVIVTKKIIESLLGRSSSSALSRL